MTINTEEGRKLHVVKSTKQLRQSHSRKKEARIPEEAEAKHNDMCQFSHGRALTHSLGTGNEQPGQLNSLSGALCGDGHKSFIVYNTKKNNNGHEGRLFVCTSVPNELAVEDQAC